jgi:hypothetical protein
MKEIDKSKIKFKDCAVKTCVTCGDHFLCSTKKGRHYTVVNVRGMNSKTCSKRCSKDYMQFLSKKWVLEKRDKWKEKQKKKKKILKTD